MIHVTTFGNFMPLKHLAHCTIGSSHNPASLLILSVCIFTHSANTWLLCACIVATLGPCEWAGWFLSRGSSPAKAQGVLKWKFFVHETLHLIAKQLKEGKLVHAGETGKSGRWVTSTMRGGRTQMA